MLEFLPFADMNRSPWVRRIADPSKRAGVSGFRLRTTEGGMRTIAIALLTMFGVTCAVAEAATSKNEKPQSAGPLADAHDGMAKIDRDDQATTVLGGIVGLNLNPDNIKTANIFLLPPNMEFITRLTESALTGSGCPFFTQEQKQIRILVSILENADLRFASYLDAPWVTEPREGVFLNLSDGAWIKFIFTIKYSNESPTHGYYKQKSNVDAVNITVNDEFVNELVQWAANLDDAADGNRKINQACKYYQHEERTGK
jgi:hypothetical protein